MPIDWKLAIWFTLTVTTPSVANPWCRLLIGNVTVFVHMKMEGGLSSPILGDAY